MRKIKVCVSTMRTCQTQHEEDQPKAAATITVGHLQLEILIITIIICAMPLWQIFATVFCKIFIVITIQSFVIIQNKPFLVGFWCLQGSRSYRVTHSGPGAIALVAWLSGTKYKREPSHWLWREFTAACWSRWQNYILLEQKWFLIFKSLLIKMSNRKRYNQF